MHCWTAVENDWGVFAQLIGHGSFRWLRRELVKLIMVYPTRKYGVNAEQHRSQFSHDYASYCVGWVMMQKGTFAVSDATLPAATCDSLSETGLFGNYCLFQTQSLNLSLWHFAASVRSETIIASKRNYQRIAMSWNRANVIISLPIGKLQAR